MNEGIAGQVPTTPNPASAGQPDDIKAKLEQLEKDKAELERAVKGIKADLLSEREKRQQLEAARNTVPAGNQATDPVDNLLGQKFQQFAKPLVDEVVNLKQQLELQKAKNYIAKRAGVDSDDVESSDAWKDVLRVAQEKGVRGTDPLNEAKIAWELLEKERREKQEAAAKAEAERQKAIQGNASITSSAPNAPSSNPTVLKQSDLERLSPRDPRTAEIVRDIKSGKIQLIPG